MLAKSEFSLFPKPSKGLDRHDWSDQLIPMDLQETDCLLLTHGDEIVIDFPMKTQQDSQSQTTS